MSKGKLIIAFISIIALSLALYAAFGYRNGEGPGVKPVVVASIFPVYDFARAVGGDLIEVSMLLKPGLEAHSYEPKPSDIGRLAKASLFIYTGADMEPWAADLASGVAEDHSLVVLEAGKGSPVTILGARSEDEHSDGGSPQAPASIDPHIWLDFDNAAHMVRAIAAALAGVDPVNATSYSDNAEAFCLQLSALDEEFKSAIARCSKRTIIHGGHYAFGYLAGRYGLDYVSAMGFSPDSELGPREMASLIDLMTGTGSKYIFYEELVEPKAAELVSKETGAGMLMLHAGHNISKSEFDSGTTFIDLMKKNLENLKTGLEYIGKQRNDY